MSQVQILWVNRTESSTLQRVKEHTHPFYHALYVGSGSARATVDGEDYTVSGGSFILFPREHSHSFRYAEGSNEFLEIKFIIPDEDLDARVSALEPEAVSDPVLCALFRSVIEEYAENRARGDEAARAYLQSILYSLTGQQRQAHRAATGYISTEGLSDLSVRVIAYLEQNTDHDVSLDELAQELDMTKNYLCNAFRRDTGTTIGNCKNLLRIRKAAELIAYSDLDLSVVAQQCGFATVAHFTHTFTKYVGIPPSKCRRAYPADILVHHPKREESPVDNRFMRNVLADMPIDLK